MNREKDLSLTALHRGIERCRKCRLWEGRHHAVPGEGPGDAPIMLIGEAPGEKEDLEGRPFCGRSGVFLDELLDTAGLSRRDIYITSSVKCRPPNNRDPKPDELETCRAAWLERQIDIVDPPIVVLLGKVAAMQVLEDTRPLRDIHGRRATRNGRIVLPTYHPAAGMRFPDIGQALRADFQTIRRELDARRRP